jgi:hypothetical protein
MRLLFSYNTSYKPNNTIPQNQNINSNSNTSKNTAIPDIKVSSFVSIFERLKNTGKCNSCSGAR